MFEKKIGDSYKRKVLGEEGNKKQRLISRTQRRTKQRKREAHSSPTERSHASPPSTAPAQIAMCLLMKESKTTSCGDEGQEDKDVKNILKS